MLALLLWVILLVFCWPVALLLLFLHPLVWLVLVPFRLAGAVVGGVLQMVMSLILLPLRLLFGRSGKQTSRGH